MQAEDIMSRPVLAVRENDSIRAAAGTLAEHGFTAAPVVDRDGILVGIVTEADLIHDAIPHDPRAAEHHLDTPSGAPPTLVNQVMTRKVRTAAPDTDCADIAKTMLSHHLRAVPVVQNRVVVGIVTRRDLMRGLARDDPVIRAEVRRNLDRNGGFDKWSVSVRDGAVLIIDPVGDIAARHVARALALATPGTRQVQVIEHRAQPSPSPTRTTVRASREEDPCESRKSSAKER
ncbi:CBS domain-containing protein [Saccharopolyspora shandongensis]|uniref:CBS domain-containing protein n=1 Tax=Saccharopolyspora shandongensis TaxID=418495 RepID=A0A1H3QVW8_9PSEU|nr:CBS domain-containing protein [Saccharopolyspora shandongensis]SDZ17742.1 CBS domain-containing protein [Saccharopolyspora shandongensis]